MGAKHFSTEATGLPAAGTADVLKLSDGDAVDLRIAPVAKQLGDDTVRMLAYNGSIPGPTLKVRKDPSSSSTSRTKETWRRPCIGTGCASRTASTGHTRRRRRSRWVRASPTGSRPLIVGVYWYHPHIREDYGQELGLYGNILVTPTDPDYWPPVNREILLTLDDILIEDGKVASFSESETTYVAMGRFGNVLLVAASPSWR